MPIRHLSDAKKNTASPRFMRINNLTSYLAFSKSYINTLIKAGKFPVGVNIGSNLKNSGKVVVWEKRIIDQWADKYINIKDNGNA